MYDILQAAIRRNSAGIVSPQFRPWKDGRSFPGGTHTDKVPQEFTPTNAPNVATRVSPGTVPPRKRAMRPEMRPNGL